jgi:hypothetical protein
MQMRLGDVYWLHAYTSFTVWSTKEFFWVHYFFWSVSLIKESRVFVRVIMCAWMSCFSWSLFLVGIRSWDHFSPHQESSLDVFPGWDTVDGQVLVSWINSENASCWCAKFCVLASLIRVWFCNDLAVLIVKALVPLVLVPVQWSK